MSRSTAELPLTFSHPIRLRRFEDTGGAIRYQEIDGQGAFIPNNDDCVVGGVYIRKHAFGDQTPPEALSIFIVKD